MGRTNERDLSNIAEHINKITGDKGVSIQYYNGMVNIHLINKEKYKRSATTDHLLYCGTKNECYDFLSGVRKAITEIMK